MRSNNKEVKAKIREHISEYYTPEELKAQVNAIKCACYPTNYHAVRHMVEGGCFLIYNNDIRSFINELNLNSNNKTYGMQETFNLYAHLIARDAELIIKNAN